MATPMPIATTKEQSNRILELLDNQPRSTAELISETGLAGIEVAKIIFDLKQHAYLETKDIVDGRSGDKITKHRITPAGRVLWQQISPRKFNKKTNGYKHVHGVIGKIDYNRPLQGLKAKVYEILTREMNAREIATASNLELQPVWNVMTSLVDLDIVSFREKNDPKTNANTRYYARKREIPIEDEVEESPPPRPTLQPYTHGNAIVEAVIQKTQPIAAGASDTLETEVDLLLQKYPLPEIMFILHVRLETEWREMKDIQTRFFNAALNASNASNALRK